jgi:hypothetical protein
MLYSSSTIFYFLVLPSVHPSAQAQGRSTAALPIGVMTVVRIIQLESSSDRCGPVCVTAVVDVVVDCDCGTLFICTYNQQPRFPQVAPREQASSMC